PTAMSAAELRTMEKATATGSRCMRASLPIFQEAGREKVRNSMHSADNPESACAFEGNDPV
ncbi:MAG TPA: hypothetical protein VIG03_04340, partial [Steroidobacteraceae bacterium]